MPVTPRMPGETQFAQADDYRDYLSRLHELPAVMDEYIALMRKGLETGMTQPRVVLDGRDEPIRAQLVDAVEDSPFYGPFLELPSPARSAYGGRAPPRAASGPVSRRADGSPAHAC